MRKPFVELNMSVTFAGEAVAGIGLDVGESRILYVGSAS